MQELEIILRDHAARYPLMQPTDAVKLIYQNEFGGGHLIQNQNACLDYLQQEYAAVAKDPNKTPFEEIGNGIIRVHLAALKADDLNRLGHAFILSAAEHTGSIDCFIQKLSLLHEMTAAGLLPFPLAALESYLAAYRAAGYPMVSHSQIYRDAYQPSYRIVLRRHFE